MNTSNRNTPRMHHPCGQNVTTSIVGFKNGHVRTNLTQNGETQRYNRGRRRRRIRSIAMLGLQVKQPVSRTHSAPLRSSQLSLSQSVQHQGTEQATDTEINARLDSLCLSMTEHALGGGESHCSFQCWGEACLLR